MKHIFFIIVLLSYTNIYSQDPIILQISFDNPSFQGGKYKIDTTDIDNIWQVGPPQKTLFNFAQSFPNVMVTDTINSYPINDTSSFILEFYADPFSTKNAIEGYYYCDTDSLNDYGMIEVSGDHGQNWYNLLSDTSNIFNSNVPVLTGSTGSWKLFSIDYDPTLIISPTDTILFRFTFISDSIDTDHEGLMFDSFGFFPTNTKNLYQLNNLKVFPNPTKDILHFQLEERLDDAEIRIYSTLGQLITRQNITTNLTPFNTSDWHRGMYFYGIYVGGQLVKQGQVLIDR